MEENQIKKSRRASEFADPYSIEGEEKYPAKLMRKRSKEYFRRSVPNERNNFGRPVTNERNSSGNSVPTCSEGNEREQNVPDRRPIQHLPENKKNEASSTAVSYEFNVDEEADYYAIYKRSLIQTRSFLALDSSMTVYVVLDFDTERKVLLKSLSQLVYRKDMNFYCSCDENRRQYLENIDSIVEQEADLYHPPCFHVKAVREIYEMFVCSNDLDERHSLNESAVKDHRYSMDQISDFQECNILEIPFMEDVYAICIKAKYGIVKIGFGNIRCITCKQRSDCSHAKYLNDLFIKFENQELPEILEKIDMKLFKYSNTSYQLSCLSTKRIPFYLTQELSERICQSPEDVLIKEDGIFKALTVMESDNCPSCGTLFDPDYVDQKQRTQCILLTRYKMEEVQCKESIHSVLYTCSSES